MPFCASVSSSIIPPGWCVCSDADPPGISLHPLSYVGDAQPPQLMADSPLNRRSESTPCVPHTHCVSICGVLHGGMTKRLVAWARPAQNRVAQQSPRLKRSLRGREDDQAVQLKHGMTEVFRRQERDLARGNSVLAADPLPRFLRACQDCLTHSNPSERDAPWPSRSASSSANASGQVTIT